MTTEDYLDPDIETAALHEIQELQQSKLAKQLDYLFARSAFYREKFERAGIRREHYRVLSDLSRFPFTTKEELRESQAGCPLWVVIWPRNGPT